MKRAFLVLCILSLLLIACIGASAKSVLDTVMIFIEAEDCVYEGYEAEATEGAVGKALYAVEAETNKITVTFDAPKAGKYWLWLKVFSASGTDNSLKYTLSDGVERVFDFMEDPLGDPEFPFYGKWAWVQMADRGTEPLANGYGDWNLANNLFWHTPFPIDAKAGSNSVTFICREAGHYIDQVIITDDRDYHPGAVEGNYTYLCAMCNMEHYVLEPYADMGINLEAVWADKVEAERAALEPPPAPETEAVEVQTPAAPQTYDMTAVGFAVAAAAAAVIAQLKRRVR